MTKTNRITRRTFSTSALAAATALGMPRVARAQAYPNRPVRLILPFAAGGVADVTSRLAAEKLGEKLGQRFVVENMPGPGGIAAARAMISAPPDGYTLGLITNGTSISAAIYKKLPFDPVKDLVPISRLGNFVLVLAVNAESPHKTLADFMKAAREQPGKLNFGTIAVGSTQQLGAELYRSSAKLNIQLIPYKTTPDVIVGLLRNDIQMMTDFYAAMRAGLLDKRLRPLAVSGSERSSNLPDVPTVAEAGVPGYEVLSWNGIGAPVGTPQPVIDTLNKAIHEVLAIPDVIKRYNELGIEARASTPAELRERLIADIKKWSDVIERAKIPEALTPAMPVYLRLYEDILPGGASAMRLPALPRMIFIVHGCALIEGRSLNDGEAWAGEGELTLAAAQQGVAAWRFEVAEDGAAAGAVGGVSRLKLSAALETLPQGDLLLRGDSVAFPPGGCAFLHRHQGPGIRCLIEGGIRIDTHGRSTSYGPGGAWYESGPDGVFAKGAADRSSRFVRVMVLPRRLLGKSSIEYVNEEDKAKPKSQSYQIFADIPIALSAPKSDR